MRICASHSPVPTGPPATAPRGVSTLAVSELNPGGGQPGRAPAGMVDAVNRAIGLLGPAGLAVGADTVRLLRGFSRRHRPEPTPSPGAHANHLLPPTPPPGWCKGGAGCPPSVRSFVRLFEAARVFARSRASRAQLPNESGAARDRSSRSGGSVSVALHGRVLQSYEADPPVFDEGLK